MTDPALELVQLIPDIPHLALTAERLRDWLLREPGKGPGSFSDSRARALLRVAEAVDDPSLGDFARLMGSEAACRLAFHELLRDSGLVSDDEAVALIRASGAAEAGEGAVPWLVLVLAAYAWKRGYPLQELDPASPPVAHSPAHRVVRDAGQFIRRQVQRAPAERERLARRLSYTGPAASSSAGARAGTPMVPDPSIFRPPVPVRYAEVSGETISLDSAERDDTPVVDRGEPLVITDQDVAEVPPSPIRIEPGPPSPLPRSAVVVPSDEGSMRPSLTVRSRRSRPAGATTKLRVVVQEYADGPGMYGVQVEVRSRTANVKVAGATNRDGHFLCQVPVRLREGLTYQVEVTWPRDQGGTVERKSITLNADRTEFLLPFYPRYRPPEGD